MFSPLTAYDVDRFAHVSAWELWQQSCQWRRERIPILKRIGLPLLRPLIFRYNPDFEQRLGQLSHHGVIAENAPPPPQTLPEAVKSIIARLSRYMLLLTDITLSDLNSTSGPSDRLHSRQENARVLGNDEYKCGTDTDTEDADYVPWGWTPETMKERHHSSAGLPPPPLASVVQVQDRRFSHELEQQLGIGSRDARIIPGFQDLEHSLARFQGDFVLKHPFGVAGRERVSGTSARPLSVSQLGWCRQVLKRHPLILEPWLKRVQDFGVQWYLPQKGVPRLLGVLPLLNHPNGTYKGHMLGVPNDQEFPFFRSLIETGLKVLSAIQSVGYFGPVGMDAFTYLDENGGTQWRLLVEINARWTMGMLALGAERTLAAEQTATWASSGEGMAILTPHHSSVV